MLSINSIYTSLDLVSLQLLSSIVCYLIVVKCPRLKLFQNLYWLNTLSCVCVLFVYLITRWFLFQHFPLSNLYESLLFLNWCLLFSISILEVRTKIKVIGAMILPVIFFIFEFTTLILPPPMKVATSITPALQSNWLMMHVSMMITSYSVLILGSLLAILILIIYLKRSFLKSELVKMKAGYNLEHNFYDLHLYHKKFYLGYKNQVKFINTFDGFIKNLDVWSYRLLSLGFPLLTLGIISGGVWANEAWGAFWSWDPKETWALITWLVFAIYLHIRLTGKDSYYTSALVASFGFVTVWVCYLGVNFLGQGLHTYGFLRS